MKNYIDYVILLIDKEGNEVFVNISDDYHKHIQPFKKLDDRFMLEDFLKYKGTDNITGYDIASYLGGMGNIVFFHTDVSNWRNNKKNASIIIPEDMSCIQKEMLLELIQNLKKEEFDFYLNIVKFKNLKSYKVIHNHVNLALLLRQVYNIGEDRESRNDKCKKTRLVKN